MLHNAPSETGLPCTLTTAAPIGQAPCVVFELGLRVRMARSSSGARVRVVSSLSGAQVRGLERSSPPVTIFVFHTNKLASATARTRHTRISSA